MRRIPVSPCVLVVWFWWAVCICFFCGVLYAQTKYSRSQYRHWIDSDRNCRDTRQEVLIRDSFSADFLPENECRVVSGLWHDPYSDQTFTDPKKLDVDHMVPLKNAHESGASEWNREKKKAYANYLGYKDHLIAVSARENRRKGARGPEEYKPPNLEFHCQYAEAWSSVKQAWGLSSTPEERAALLEMLRTCK